MPRRRALLLDACCVVPASHNPRACRLFARALTARGFEPRYLVPLHGRAAFPGEEAAVDRVLPYPYGPRYGTVEGAPHHRLDATIDGLLEPHRGGARRRLGNLLPRLVADARVERLLAPALAAELDRLALGPADLVLLPTADLYVTAGLLRWLRRQDPRAAPALALRFLAKLEADAVHRPYERLRGLLRRVERLRRAGYRIVLAAEIEPWARRMERRAGMPVLLLPTPPDPGPAKPAASAGRLGVSLVSLRRREQGAGRLLPILRSLPEAARRRLDVVSQVPPLQSADAFAALGVTVVADSLCERDLAAVLAPLDVTLLPYLPETYVTRGSSMLFEAANHGHAILASAGCGFSAEVEAFGLGGLCGSDAEFAAALVALLEDGDLRARSQAAAERYNAYREACFDRALAALGT